jgi:hypothetical protein
MLKKPPFHPNVMRIYLPLAFRKPRLNLFSLSQLDLPLKNGQFLVKGILGVQANPARPLGRTASTQIKLTGQFKVSPLSIALSEKVDFTRGLLTQLHHFVLRMHGPFWMFVKPPLDQPFEAMSEAHGFRPENLGFSPWCSLGVMDPLIEVKPSGFKESWGQMTFNSWSLTSH